MNKETFDFVWLALRFLFGFILVCYFIVCIVDLFFSNDLGKQIVNIYDYTEYGSETSITLRDVELGEGKIFLKEMMIMVPRKTFNELKLENYSRAVVHFKKKFMDIQGKVLQAA